MWPHQIDQLILLQRLLIIFGSIALLWLIIGLIFLAIETFRHVKKKTNQKLSGHNLALHLPSTTLANNQRTLAGDYLSDNAQNDEDDSLDDQTSIITSVSFISDRPKLTHEHSYFTASCRRISNEHFTLTPPSATGTSNLAYRPSTLSSSIDNDPSLFYYPACRNFAYSQSTLASTNDNFEQKTSTPSLSMPLINSTSSAHQFNFERQTSQSSTDTSVSQMTHATSLSSKSSIKMIPLPTLMITDVDRLQTDIIELEEFEPEKDWHRPGAQLRLLLNDRLPSQVK